MPHRTIQTSEMARYGWTCYGECGVEANARNSFFGAIVFKAAESAASAISRHHYEPIRLKPPASIRQSGREGRIAKTEAALWVLP